MTTTTSKIKQSSLMPNLSLSLDVYLQSVDEWRVYEVWRVSGGCEVVLSWESPLGCLSRHVGMPRASRPLHSVRQFKKVNWMDYRCYISKLHDGQVKICPGQSVRVLIYLHINKTKVRAEVLKYPFVCLRILA